MKKLLLPLCILMMFLGACSNEEPAVIEDPEEVVEEENVEAATEETEEVQEEVAEIDTSVFEYAEAVEVTNSIELTKHVNLFIDMSEELSPGMASQHVLNQTYDFLQQSDLEGAETVTINVRQAGEKVFMFTSRIADFAPNDETPMSDVVIAASEIEFMTPAVEEFGKTMELW